MQPGPHMALHPGIHSLSSIQAWLMSESHPPTTNFIIINKFIIIFIIFYLFFVFSQKLYLLFQNFITILFIYICTGVLSHLYIPYHVFSLYHY